MARPTPHAPCSQLVLLRLLAALSLIAACSTDTDTDTDTDAVTVTDTVTVTDADLHACPHRPTAGQVMALLSDCAADFQTGLLAAGRPGDGLIANALVRFTVRAGPEGHGLYGTTGGHLVDVVRVTGDGTSTDATSTDALRELALTVDLHMLRPTAIEPFERDGGRGLRVVGDLAPLPTLQASLGKPKPDVTVVHEYLLKPDSPVLEIRTKVTPNPGAKVPSVFVGDVMLWGGEVGLYLPGHGADGLPLTALTPTMGVTPRRPASGVVAAALSAAQALSVVDAGGILALVWPSQKLPAEGLDYVRYLAVGGDPGGGESGVDLAATMAAAGHAAGGEAAVATRRLKGKVDGPGSHAGLVVEALDEDDNPLTRCAVASDSKSGGAAGGTVDCPIPLATRRLLPGWIGNGHGHAGESGQVDAAKTWTVPEGDGDVTANLPAPDMARLPVSVRNHKGEPIPFRLTAEPLTGDKDLGRSLADADGSATFELPPGKWSLWLHHGPRHGEHHVELTLKPGDNKKLEVKLAEVVPMSGWIAADFHVHAEQSTDSSVANGRRLTGALAEDVQYVVATDHDFVTDYRPWLKAAGLQGKLVVANGVEVSTIKFGHFNLWPLKLQPNKSGNGAPAWLGLQAEALLDLLRGGEAKRVIQCNHPRFSSASYFDKIEFDAAKTPKSLLRVDTMELVNGIGHGDTEQVLTDWMGLLNRGIRIVATATSDCHGLSSPVGHPRTLIRMATDGGKVPPFTAAEADVALKAGRVIATGGPLLEVTLADAASQTAAIGELLSAPDGPLTARIRLRAPAWLKLGKLRLYRNGEALEEMDVSATPAAGGKRDLELLWSASDGLAEGTDAWVVAVHVPGAKSEPGIARPAWAVTNPVFIDGDGDGKWRNSTQ